MSNVKLEVQWSPAHANKFITWGTEICLYEVARIKDTVRPSCKYEYSQKQHWQFIHLALNYFLSTGVKISDSTTAHLLATNTNHHYVKCIDIYPQQEPDILLAVGQANGKVVLTTFGPTAFDSLGLTGKELGFFLLI